MRKAAICVGGILCLGLAAIAGVHMYESVTTKHADAATTTVPRTGNATVTSVNKTRHAPHPPRLPPRQPPRAPEPPPRQPPKAPERPAPKPRDPGPWAPPINRTNLPVALFSPYPRYGCCGRALWVSWSCTTSRFVYSNTRRRVDYRGIVGASIFRRTRII